MLRALALLLALNCVTAWSADYAREQRWADEIVPGIVVGDPLWLTTASGRKFLALYENPRGAKFAAIVVHGAGVHPDWGLVNVLRSRLPESGIATLATQMPVLAADAKPEAYPATFPEANERLRAAVAFLRDKGYARIAIVSHSMGARMANHFLIAAPGPGVAAWASLGISGGGFEAPERLGIPVLDLYGERDLPQVIAGAEARAQAIRGLRGSAQIQVADADHFFNGQEEPMVRRVRTFLERSFAR